LGDGAARVLLVAGASIAVMPGVGRVGDKAVTPADAHGCPHPVVGPATVGSPNVRVNSRPALRADDPGVHAACCGPNIWHAAQGSGSVLINGKPAHRLGDQVTACGGAGSLVEGSGNVNAGG
jgi:uncharacterized Zn-binding protein involved in type VI secretion